MTLLSVAKGKKARRRLYVRERCNEGEIIDLAIAWLQGEIQTVQAQAVLNVKSPAAANAVLVSAIKRAGLRGVLKIRKGKARP